jgi:hypothetical protein
MKAMPSGFDKIADVFDQSAQSDQTKDLKTALGKLRHKIIVLVDEIDRLDALELNTLFKVLKGIDDLPRVTFVCALHKEGIVKALGGDSEYQYSYIEKFFPFQMPVPSVDPSAERWRSVFPSL